MPACGNKRSCSLGGLTVDLRCASLLCHHPFACRPWTTFLPLGIVLGVAMVKEAVEDYKRHRQDVEVNNRPVEVSICCIGLARQLLIVGASLACKSASCWSIQHLLICQGVCD